MPTGNYTSLTQVDALRYCRSSFQYKRKDKLSIWATCKSKQVNRRKWLLKWSIATQPVHIYFSWPNSSVQLFKHIPRSLATGKPVLPSIAECVVLGSWEQICALINTLFTLFLSPAYRPTILEVKCVTVYTVFSVKLRIDCPFKVLVIYHLMCTGMCSVACLWSMERRGEWPCEKRSLLDFAPGPSSSMLPLSDFSVAAWLILRKTLVKYLPIR